MSMSTKKKNRGQCCFTGLKQDLPEEFIPDNFFFLFAVQGSEWHLGNSAQNYRWNKPERA